MEVEPRWAESACLVPCVSRAAGRQSDGLALGGEQRHVMSPRLEASGGAAAAAVVSVRVRVRVRPGRAGGRSFCPSARGLKPRGNSRFVRLKLSLKPMSHVQKCSSRRSSSGRLLGGKVFVFNEGHLLLTAFISLSLIFPL